MKIHIKTPSRNEVRVIQMPVFGRLVGFEILHVELEQSDFVELAGAPPELVQEWLRNLYTKFPPP